MMDFLGLSIKIANIAQNDDSRWFFLDFWALCHICEVSRYVARESGQNVFNPNPLSRKIFKKF